MQTSGKSCRENADVYPLFDIRIEFPPRHCEFRTGLWPTLVDETKRRVVARP